MFVYLHKLIPSFCKQGKKKKKGERKKKKKYYLPVMTSFLPDKVVLSFLYLLYILKDDK